ncbi:MAG: sugar transferase, partial [Planctomycetota bacterium]
MAKRLFDFLAAFTALILLLPVLVTAALGIRLSSSGPALYRARRIGCGGREFVMLKFRTMHVAARPGSAITAASDSRVFPLGRVLCHERCHVDAQQLRNLLMQRRSWMRCVVISNCIFVQPGFGSCPL